MNGHDHWAIRLALIGLGFIALAVVLGSIVLAFYGRTMPPEVVGLGGTALGALSAFFVSTRLIPSPNDDPIPVAVQQPAGEPVPVSETKPKVSK